MILDNLTVRGKQGKKQVLIDGEKINAVADTSFAGPPNETRIRFEDAIALPGFINSHDHLDFNLYPSLAHGKYNNYREWGTDIHERDKTTIDEVLKIPLALRAEWGIYKNLLCGFTTVVNHGDKLNCPDDLVTVFEDCYPLHSPGFEKNWKWKLNSPFHKAKPFVMHIGEGRDTIAKDEIDEVIKANWLHKKIIAVHGIQMDARQAAAFKGLVWCPASNYFLIGKTADVKQLKGHLPVVFGTDSTLSATWNAWQHFREGAQSGITEDELVGMLTTAPASLWNLTDRGDIDAGKRADILILKDKRDHFFDNNPGDILMVVHRGQVRLYDSSLADQLPANGFSRVKINGSIKFIQGDLPRLIRQIQTIQPKQDLPVDLI